MPARPSHIPAYRERCALQTFLGADWLPVADLYPAGPSTIAGMVNKGWIEQSLDAAGMKYRITPAGRAALKAVIPTKRLNGRKLPSGELPIDI